MRGSVRRVVMCGCVGGHFTVLTGSDTVFDFINQKAMEKAKYLISSEYKRLYGLSLEKD